MQKEGEVGLDIQRVTLKKEPRRQDAAVLQPLREIRATQLHQFVETLLGSLG